MLNSALNPAGVCTEEQRLYAFPPLSVQDYVPPRPSAPLFQPDQEKHVTAESRPATTTHSRINRFVTYVVSYWETWTTTSTNPLAEKNISLTRQLEERSSRLLEQEKKIEALSNQLRSVKKRNAEKKETIHSLQKKLSDQQVQVHVSEDHALEWKQRVTSVSSASRDESLRVLTEINDNYKKMLDDLLPTLGKHMETEARFAMKERQLAEDNQSLVKLLHDSEELTKRLHRRIADLENENASLKTALSLLEKQK